MNDFPTRLKDSMGNQFADDAITYAQRHTSTDVQTLKQTEIIHAKEWLSNKLSLNTSKCGSMLVRLLHSYELRVELDNQLLKDLS